MSSPDRAAEKKDVAATATPPADAPEAPAAPAEKEEVKEAQSAGANEEAKGNTCCQNPLIVFVPLVSSLSRHPNTNKHPQLPMHVPLTV